MNNGKKQRDSSFGSTNRAFVKEYKSQWANVKETIFNELRGEVSSLCNSVEKDPLEKSIKLDKVRWHNNYPSMQESLDSIINWSIQREAVFDNMTSVIKE